MSNKKVLISSYLPSDKIKKSENFGNLRMKIKNLNENKIFADTEDLKKLRRKKIAQDFVDQYTQGLITSKAKFCKTNKIAVQTLNKGLQENGVIIKSKSSDESSEDGSILPNIKKQKKPKEPKEPKEEVKENRTKKDSSNKGGAVDSVKRGKAEELINNLKI